MGVWVEEKWQSRCKMAARGTQGERRAYGKNAFCLLLLHFLDLELIDFVVQRFEADAKNLCGF